MTCHREHRDGVWFFCTSGSTFADKPPRCSVCGGARASLLCDGPLEDNPSKTCDAPIHRRCSVRAATCSVWEAMELLANRAARRMPKPQRPELLKPEPDTIDFCPSCAARFRVRENERQARGDGAKFVKLKSTAREGKE